MPPCRHAGRFFSVPRRLPLIQRHLIDGRRIVLAGYSQGGAVALGRRAVAACAWLFGGSTEHALPQHTSRRSDE